MSEKIPVKDLERMMMHDAIQWMEGLADAQKNTEFAEADADLLRQYRALYKRRYGVRRTKLDTMLEGAVLVNIRDIKGGGRS